jgi:hypothetical protein
MDSNVPPAPVPPGGENMPEWEADFEREREKIREAAAEWGVRWNEPEGRFISALVGAIDLVGKFSASAQKALVQTTKEGRIAAEADLQKAKEIHKAAQLALTQIRNIELAAKAEHEIVALQMIDRTMPLFTERLEKVLVVREQRWNKDVARRRYATAGAIVLAIFLGGFGLSRWETHDMVARMETCLLHPLQAGGHSYCRIDGS